MTDKELLEKAAKAAGLQEWGWMADTLTHVVNNRFVFWDPLTDDGDALRLAVKLGIEIHPDLECEEVVTAFCVRNPSLVGLNTREEFEGDAMKATRRAVTRAAAKIYENS